MLYGQVDKQNEPIIAICKHCEEEIYKDDLVRNLEQIVGDDFIIHNDCVSNFCNENASGKDLITEWFRDNDLFADMVKQLTTVEIMRYK